MLKVQNLLIATALLFSVMHHIQGQNKSELPKTLKVGLYTNPPFVMEANGLFNPMAWDLKA